MICIEQCSSNNGYDKYSNGDEDRNYQSMYVYDMDDMEEKTNHQRKDNIEHRVIQQTARNTSDVLDDANKKQYMVRQRRREQEMEGDMYGHSERSIKENNDDPKWKRAYTVRKTDEATAVTEILRQRRQGSSDDEKSIDKINNYKGMIFLWDTNLRYADRRYM